VKAFNSRLKLSRREEIGCHEPQEGTWQLSMLRLTS
jgi:hypothetical protein